VRSVHRVRHEAHAKRGEGKIQGFDDNLTNEPEDHDNFYLPGLLRDCVRLFVR